MFRSNRNIIILLVLIACTAILFLHSAYYYPFLSDDALISLRYAERLLEGKGLTWTDGKPVEGYSNLLWILLVSALGLFGMDLIDASRLLGFLGMLTVIFSLLKHYVSDQKERTCWPAVFTSLFFFCMAAPVAVWAIGGLEQPLYAALIALAIPLTVQLIESDKPRKQTILFLSFMLGLICLTRPDGPLFSVAAFLSVYIGRHATGKTMLSRGDLFTFVSIPLLFYISQLGFRLYYYGEWVPNTALVKISPSLHHTLSGAKYVAFGMLALFPFSLLAICSIVMALLEPDRRSIGLSLFMICALWIPYIIFVGGDIFPAFRHFIPLIVVFAFALAESTNIIIKKLPHKISHRYKAFFVIACLIIYPSYLAMQFTNPANRLAISERWEWDGKVVGLILNNAFFEQQPLLAVTAAGCLPYSSKLPSLDMLGLNDYFLPRNPPTDIGKGVIGHELGDGNYVLKQQPDIIVFRTGYYQAFFRSGIEMQQTTEFHEQYTPIKILRSSQHEHQAVIWIRKYSPRIGIQIAENRIVIPGFLLNGNPESFVYANDQGKLVVSIDRSLPASTKIKDVFATNWHIQLKTSNNEEIQCELKQIEKSLSITLTTKGNSPIAIEEIVLTKK